MPQKTFAGGLALQSSVKNTLLVVALLCLLSASDNAAPAASSGSRFWAGCVMIKDEPFQRNNL